MQLQRLPFNAGVTSSLLDQSCAPCTRPLCVVSPLLHRTCKKVWKGLRDNDWRQVSPSLDFNRAHVAFGPASGCIPSRNVVAIAGSTPGLEGTCSCSFMSFPCQEGLPALSIVVCCSRAIVMQIAPACVASARIRDCSFGNAKSLAVFWVARSLQLESVQSLQRRGPLCLAAAVQRPPRSQAKCTLPVLPRAAQGAQSRAQPWLHCHVQVVGCPVRRCRRKCQLGCTKAQASKTRGATSPFLTPAP